MKKHAGETRKVLFEKQQQGSMMEGYTDNYIRVLAPFKKEWVNRVVDWTV